MLFILQVSILSEQIINIKKNFRFTSRTRYTTRVNVSRHKTVKAVNRNLNAPESSQQVLVTQADAFGGTVTSEERCDVGRKRGDNKRSAWVSLSASFLLLLPCCIDMPSRALIHAIVYALSIVFLSVCAAYFCAFFLMIICASWPQSMI